MKKKNRVWLGLGVAACVGLALGLGLGLGFRRPPSDPDEPEAMIEYRALWMATVDNIDWPKESTSSQETKQQELITYLDLMVELKMNTLYFQIRPHGDALYNSSTEPWSEYITGKQGQPPVPSWDPLEFVTKEAHARNIQLHAWFNPYRAMKGSHNISKLAPNHMCRLYPDYCYVYGPDMWMDPSSRQVQDRFINVVVDVIQRYEVDGVHIDDYFYPWPVEGEEFPDNTTYQQFVSSGGKYSLFDWRRDNVNRLVRRYYHEVKQAKENISVSISPFGLYRPGHPDGMQAPIVGGDPFSLIYADTLKWIQEGWLDVLVPQIYWNLESTGQPFEEVLKWWLREEVNPHRKQIIAGCALYKTEAPLDWDMQEMVDQIQTIRKYEGQGASGSCLFNARLLRDNVKESVSTIKKVFNGSASLQPPLPYRGPEEHRGVWIATLFNIDWPMTSTTDQNTNRQELLDYLDLLQELHFNAIYFQMRPHGDALYNSNIEPWSEYLTGKQGDTPDPLWDPLEFAIREGHKRGIQVHAWLNPYRARRNDHSRDALAGNHMCLAMPDYCYNYGADLWMDPGIPAVRERFIQVVEDLIDRYDIDGVHIDDYFYPAPVTGVDFPDNATYQQYLDGGGNLPLADWRRQNTADLISDFYHKAKAKRQNIVVSISPAGLYRAGEPGGMPPPITGFDPYKNLYIDPKQWLDDGWLDYFMPQIYWNISSPGQPFTDILNWWLANNPNRRPIITGNALYKTVAVGHDWEPKEMADQIDVVRERKWNNAEGSTMFSAKYLRDNDKQCRQTFKDSFKQEAKIPSPPLFIDKN